jgi:hypothetical protein
MRRDAQVIFEEHEQLIDCVVHDISNGGARLSFAAPSGAYPVHSPWCYSRTVFSAITNWCGVVAASWV